MKISIYDKDMYFAAQVAVRLRRLIKNVEVDYCTAIDDPDMAAKLVIADPSPLPTKEWLDKFRLTNPTGGLILASAAADLLSGSVGDACYAVTKPIKLEELLDIISYQLSGRPIFFSKKEMERSS